MARTRRKTDLTVRVVSDVQDAESEIRRIRKDIDTLDADILKLLCRRAEEVLEIGRLKGGRPGAVYRPEREVAIYKRLFAVNRAIPGSKLSDEAVTSLFREIISVCRSLEAPLTVAYFGQKTSYTHLAAIDLFGNSTNFLPHRTVGEVFDSVEAQRAHHGVIPIENSTEGIVNVTLDTLLGSRLTIIQENYLLIHHCLLTREKDFRRVKKLYSHPQPFAQCRRWIERYLPNAQLHEMPSTAAAAQRVATERGAAAIASREAATEYGVPLLAEHIEDHSDNFTRFVVVSKGGRTERTGDDKTSLIFSIPDEPGALQSVITAFARNRINMTKILSRPSRRRVFDYSFFVDIDGHQNDLKVQDSLKDVQKHTSSFRILGSYPRARSTPGRR